MNQSQTDELVNSDFTQLVFRLKDEITNTGRNTDLMPDQCIQAVFCLADVLLCAMFPIYGKQAALELFESCTRKVAKSFEDE